MRLALIIGLLAAGARLCGAGEDSQTQAAHSSAGTRGEEASLTARQGKTKHENRLIHETSPYLLQHAHNPVDWYPWGDEALERAKAEDKPIFLSIGYSACHWCHVMAHESFESEAIAAVLNEHFISIKVDREERPDLDEIYMTAVVAMTGAGGWPMSVFLTPELEPFYGGTYYPPEDRMGRTGFKRLLLSIAHAWETRREEVDQQAEALTEHLKENMAPAPAAGSAATEGVLSAAADALSSAYDPRHGGWGGAPKFPSPPTISLLLRQHRHTGDAALLDMATHTLRRMALGGMYDHLGGGFHRYSVDAEWRIPHFEKMLYDNAQLAEVYIEAHQATGDPFFRRVAEETFAYVLRDMRDPAGGFHSSEDADSEGEEGRFYLWSQNEIEAILGTDAAETFCAQYGVRNTGNFQSREPYHRGENVLFADEQPPDDDAGDTLARMRHRLFEVREARVRPGLDDKVLTSWNALMISALAKGAQAFGSEEYRAAAEEAGRFILQHMRKDGRLLRTYRAGESRLPGYLDDYAFTAVAFVDLYEATFDAQWLAEAQDLVDAMLEDFWDEEHGSFYFTSAAHTSLLVRARPTHDGAEPSGNSVGALALLRLARYTGRDEYWDKGERVLAGSMDRMKAAPMGFLKMLCVTDYMLRPGHEIVIAGDPGNATVRAFLAEVHRRYLPNKVVALHDPAREEAQPGPLLENKEWIEGRPAVYVCRDYVCGRPLSEPEALGALLDE